MRVMFLLMCHGVVIDPLFSVAGSWRCHGVLAGIPLKTLVV